MKAYVGPFLAQFAGGGLAAPSSPEIGMPITHLLEIPLQPQGNRSPARSQAPDSWSLSLLRRSQVGSWKKVAEKGENSCSNLRDYLRRNGAVKGQCCAAVPCWRPKCTRVFCDTWLMLPHPLVWHRGSRKLCLGFPNCEESKPHWTESGYLLWARTSRFHLLHLLGRWWHASNGADASNLFVALEELQIFRSGRTYLSQERQKRKAEVSRKDIQKAGGKSGKWKEVVWMRGR